MNFLLYALVFPAVTSGFAMWLFIRNNNNPTIESKKQLLIILVASSVISYMLLLGKDETWMATGYWVSSVFGDVKMFLGLLSYSCIFTLAGYVINSLKRPAVAQ